MTILSEEEIKKLCQRAELELHWNEIWRELFGTDPDEYQGG